MPLITSDDTTDGVVDALTLTHSSSDDNATALDGVGISFKLENATGTSTVEEWGSIDVLSTTITDGSEDADFVLSLMLAGTVTEALRLDSSDESLTIGSNATNSDGINRIRIYPQTATKGSLIISSTANSTNSTFTLQNAAAGSDVTVTIPASTTTLAGLAVAQTFTAAQTVTLDDTTDGVVDVLTLKHSSSDDHASIGDGIGISFQLENATGTSTVEEWAALDVTSATITNGAEDCDITLSAMLAGAVTQVLKVDSVNEQIIVGANATNGDGVNKVKIYPQTASKGSLILESAACAAGDFATTVVNSTGADAAVTATLPAFGGQMGALAASATTSDADSLAIPITHGIVAKTTGADGEALTLADGAPGQLLLIYLAVDGGGNGTLTPSKKTGFSTIIFADKGDNVLLKYIDDTIGWVLVGGMGPDGPPLITLA